MPLPRAAALAEAAPSALTQSILLFFFCMEDGKYWKDVLTPSLFHLVKSVRCRTVEPTESFISSSFVGTRKTLCPSQEEEET